jgi:hypothetical protein
VTPKASQFTQTLKRFAATHHLSFSAFDGLARSLASRFAVRFAAAAIDAFLARAERSSRVMFLAAALPPNLPYFCPIL